MCTLAASLSDEAEQVWVWEYETDEGAHDLYMDQGEEIRFRVADEVFLDTSPTGPSKAAETPAAPGAGAGAGAAAAAPEPEQKKEPPYTLIVRHQTLLKALVFVSFFNLIGNDFFSFLCI